LEYIFKKATVLNTGWKKTVCL